jgi:hypothetical protein
VGKPPPENGTTSAKATYTTLIDVKHGVSSAFQFINVPMGVWIDERGRVVRPAEPAWTTSSTLKFGAEKHHDRRRRLCRESTGLGH